MGWQYLSFHPLIWAHRAGTRLRFACWCHFRLRSRHLDSWTSLWCTPKHRTAACFPLRQQTRMNWNVFGASRTWNWCRPQWTLPSLPIWRTIAKNCHRTICQLRVHYVLLWTSHLNSAQATLPFWRTRHLWYRLGGGTWSKATDFSRGIASGSRIGFYALALVLSSCRGPLWSFHDIWPSCSFEFSAPLNIRCSEPCWRMVIGGGLRRWALPIGRKLGVLLCLDSERSIQVLACNAVLKVLGRSSLLAPSCYSFG